MNSKKLPEQRKPILLYKNQKAQELPEKWSGLTDASYIARSAQKIIPPSLCSGITEGAEGERYYQEVGRV